MVSRNMVILGEPGVSWPYVNCRGLMYNTKVFYFDLLHYIFCLCCFIPIWVVFILFWQVLGGYSYSSLRGEQKAIELVWTLVPSLLIGRLCYYNLQCAGSEIISACCNSVKIIGRQ